MPGSLHHLLSALGSPPGMADAMQLKPNWSIISVHINIGTNIMKIVDMNRHSVSISSPIKSSVVLFSHSKAKSINLYLPTQISASNRKKI